MAKAPVKPPPPRARRAKAEVQEEFKEILSEQEESRQSPDRKAEESRVLHESQVREVVEAVSVETVVEGISRLGLDIARALSEISAKLTAEVRQLAAIREAVAIEQAEIERLHKIDVAAAALDQLLDDYRRGKERQEAEIAAQRTTWEQEVESTARERKDQEEALKRQRQREIDDYEYKKNLERKKAQDKYDEEQRQLERKNQERQETLEKSWQIREVTLKERETDFNRLKKEADDFPARLAREVKQAAEEATRGAEARLQQETVLLKKDSESEKKLNELRVRTLEETLERQSAHILALERQLGEAKQQVQDIAVKAIEGASGARALSHVNQIAIEQAKNRPQS
ncbi:MAG: hypothetical protein NTY38_10020 [Acidobacteria bacterium]|nr:hypothetical protein [Acidobacteriota bacterium]